MIWDHILPPDQRPPTTETLRRLFERRALVRFWGQRRLCTPRVVGTVFGDGRKLLWLSAINTRPHYYVVRVDSEWAIGDWSDGADFRDHLDEIIDAIEDEFGTGITWPEASFDDGCAWGTLFWTDVDEWEHRHELLQYFRGLADAEQL